MAYLGRQPVLGNFVKLDAITVVNGQAAYTMQNGGVNFTSYDNVNQFLVSLNGILQSPTDSFTVSGSTLTFASNLSTGDVIDFVMVLGNTLDVGTPSDNTVSLAKLTATGTKDATTFLRGDNTFAEAGGGKIGQVVTGTNNAYDTSSSATSFTDVLSGSGTTWETAITPTATSSKILVLPSVYIRSYRNGSNDARGTINMMAKIGGGSYAEIDVANAFGAYDYGGSGILQDNQYVPIQLYSPSTTSEVKIKFQIKAANTSMAIQTSWHSETHFSRVTLLEVLA
uniref:Uncharacterized protein n=1 Tax=uncultured marine virus TaxID=186617 RepID=A0A0F7L163_9VIRU|nr:hypothetical protein [uncultured marine virus]